MRIRFNPLWLLVSALLLQSNICRAQIVPPSSVAFAIGGTNGGPQLWDLSGLYSLDVLVQQPNGLGTPLVVDFNMNEDGSGRLTGFVGDIQGLQLGGDIFAVSYRISGKVTGFNGQARAHFTVQFLGNGSLSGGPSGPFRATLTVDADVDSEGLQLSGAKARFSAKAPGASVRGTIFDFATPLPAGDDGTWTLTMQISALSRAVGTGVITTPDQNLGLSLSGTFKNGGFKLKARGVTDVANTVSGVGCTATILLTPDLSSMILNGKFMGQRLQFPFP
jgi:hypothetical protein